MFSYLEPILDGLSVNVLLGAVVPEIGNHGLVNRILLLVREPPAGNLVDVVEDGSNLAKNFLFKKQNK